MRVPRQITHADMESRKRMANLRSRISDALDDIDGLMYSEVLFVLGELSARWAGILRNDSLAEEAPPAKNHEWED